MRIRGCILFVLAAAALPSRAFPQASAADLTKCSQIGIAALRLQCYDALVNSKSSKDTSSASLLGESTTAFENWIGKIEVDPITDQKNATFVLREEGETSVIAPALVIRCKRGQLEFYVSTREYLSDNRYAVIRLGTTPPVRQAWSQSSDKTALFYPGKPAAKEAFVRSLADYDKLAIQVEPYSKAPKVMVFSLAGIKSVAEQLWPICGGI